MPQYTSDNTIVPMNNWLARRERNGRSFIHDMTLCNTYEVLRNTALIDSHQPYNGALKNIQNPCQIPIKSYDLLESLVLVFDMFVTIYL